MSNGESKPGAFPLAQLAALAMAAVGFLFLPRPDIQTSRPSIKEKAPVKSPPSNLLFIPARLWQDPLETVLNFRSADQKNEYDNASEARLSDICEHIHFKKTTETTAAAHSLILMASISSSSYADDGERRLRYRWATLAALGRSGFVPQTKLGFVTMGVSSNLSAQNVVPVTLPYELLEPNFGDSRLLKGTPYDHVLLLWVPDDWPGVTPLDLISTLKKLFKWTEYKHDAYFLGPSSSTSLTQFGEQVIKAAKPVAKVVRAFRRASKYDAVAFSRRLSPLSLLREKDAFLPGPVSLPPAYPALQSASEWPSFDLKVVCPRATVAPVFLDMLSQDPLREPEEVCPFEEHPLTAMRMVGIQFHRTIATDDFLASEMIHELQLRNVCVKKEVCLKEKVSAQAAACAERKKSENDEALDHVVVIAEWDTVYGRLLPLSFALAAAQPNDAARQDNDSTRRLVDTLFHTPFEQRHIHRFYYFKGIDGNIAESKPSPKPENKEAVSSSLSSLFARPSERSEGENQADYLRRVGFQIASLNHDLWNDHGKEIRAVIIMGSDVFDKLMVLRALRPVLPRALFMTDNLDAQMMAPEESQWTRNLVVVSPYGLMLHPYYQQGVPAFRDCYQTSTFASTLAVTGLLNKDIYSNSETSGGWLEFSSAKDRPAGQSMARPRVFEIGRTSPVDLSRDLAALPFGFSRLEDPGQAGERLVPSRQNDIAWWSVTLFCAFFTIILAFVSLEVTRLSLPRKGRSGRRRGTLRGWMRRRWRVLGKQLAKRIRQWPWRLNKRWIAVLFTLGLAAIFPWMLDWLQRFYFILVGATQEDGTVLNWFQGISIWPSQGLRVAAIYLAFWFIIDERKQLRAGNKQIRKKYFPKIIFQRKPWNRTPMMAGLVAVALALPLVSSKPSNAWYLALGLLALLASSWMNLSLLKRYQKRTYHVHTLHVVMGSVVTLAIVLLSFWVADAFGFFIPLLIVVQSVFVYSQIINRVARNINTHAPGQPIQYRLNPARSWKRCAVYGSLGYRLPRTLPLVVANLWLAAMLVRLCPDAAARARGEFSIMVDHTILAFTIATVSLLVSFVVDALLVSRSFVCEIRLNPTPWGTLASTHSPLGLVLGRASCEYQNMKLLEDHSKPAGRLGFAPFLILGILIAAQSELFDARSWHVPVVILACADVALICWCAWALQSESAKARKEAIENLTLEREMVSARLGSNHLAARNREDRLKVFDEVTEEIKQIRAGSFAPIWDQPLVKAALLSGGGLGLGSILSFISNLR